MDLNWRESSVALNRHRRLPNAKYDAHVLQYSSMSHTLTIRLTDELLDWLKETSRRTGIPVGRLIREQLETARAKGGKQRFLRHAGAIAGGPPNVSSRKGFSRS